MAWSWRKRKTILPGVRLNLGRKGVSTTIGPRGASITLGPNGTYVNTSIPGTGIYNRKKISGNYSKQKTNMTSNAYPGCREVFVALIAGLLWLCLLITLIVPFMAFDGALWWLGVILIVITVVTHLVVAIVSKKKESLPVTTGNESSIKVEVPSVTPATATSNTSITNEYFNDIDLQVILLMGDHANILGMKNIGSKLDSIGMSYRINGSNVTDNISKLNILYWLDMTRCYLGLNNQIDLNDKSGIGLFDIIVNTLGGRINNVNKIPEVRAVYQNKVENIVNCMKGYLESRSTSIDEFSVPKLLEGNPDLKERYITHLYRFASIAAKADNVVTEQEAEWLANIIKQKGSSSTSISQNNNEPRVTNKSTANPNINTISSGSAMNELKSLIGLASVKEEVETLTNFIKIQQARAAKGMKTSAVSYHCVFTGNPGTGKTTVARILAKIYKKLGVVTKGHLVETDRAGLVAEYVGQTAVKTNKIIDSALDGVLFIDEAYSLVQGGQSDYGKEAIATLLKRMEDDRDRLIVIIAGYTKEMKDFIDANPGLQSRFNRYIEFPDYSADELMQIFENQAKKCEYTITEGALVVLKTYFEEMIAHKDKNFGNGRCARNIFEKTMELQANRLAREVSLTADQLVKILPEDLPLQK